MKQVTVSIPDDKYEFFLDLVDQLGFEKELEIPIPEEHQQIVLERIKNSRPEELIPWDKVKDNFKFD